MSRTNIRTAPRPRHLRCRSSRPHTLSRRLLLPASVVGAAGLLTWLALPTVWWSPLNVDEELTLRLGDYSFRHIFHIVSTAARRRARCTSGSSTSCSAGGRACLALRVPVARLPVPRAARGRIDRASSARRRRRGRRGRAPDRGLADPRPLRDIRPAAHDAVRLADVVDGARPEGCGRRQPPPVDRRRGRPSGSRCSCIRRRRSMRSPRSPQRSSSHRALHGRSYARRGPGAVALSAHVRAVLRPHAARAG